MGNLPYHTVGGRAGHILRRLIHVGFILSVPWLYYEWRVSASVVLLIVGAIVVFEYIRITNRWVLFAQRTHEATHFSSFAWAALALGILLLASPGKMLTMPIAANCALIDPLVGELRAYKLNPIVVFFIGTLISTLIWGACSQIFHFPIWFAWIMGPVTIASEWPSLEWIDDNATMILIPLGAALWLYR